MLRTLVLGTTARVRANGGALAVGAHELLFALQLAAERTATFAAESPCATPATVEITAQQAAVLMGCSPQYVRYLARTGRVRARRAGPAWLIDANDLNAYRKGHSPCRPTTSPDPASARP